MLSNATSEQAMLVAFFGPMDGKSTVADLVEIRLRALNKRVFRYHWRPRLLPSLNKGAEVSEFNNPSGLSPRSLLISSICYIYFFLDFSFFKVLTKVKREFRGSIIIYERYYYDILVHPARHKLRDLPWLGRYLCRLTSTPIWL